MYTYSIEGEVIKMAANNTLGERLKQSRLDMDFTQKDLAIKVGVSDKTVSAWENGTKTPRASTLYTLARIFDKPSDYYFSTSSTDGIDEEAVITYAQNSTSDTAKKLRDHLLSAMKLLEAEQREESEVSAKFKRLTPANQTIVMTMIDTMLAQQK
jgi:transcriptional regulator with XRE-family HTH domain